MAEGWHRGGVSWWSSGGLDGGCMRLRELAYPVALKYRDGLVGGELNGFGRPSRWNANLAEFWLQGGFPELSIFACDGWEYTIDELTLSPLSTLKKLALDLMLESASGLADIDATLAKVKYREPSELCKYLLDLVLSNPKWWERHSERAEIESMFDGCSTYRTIINAVGILDLPGGKISKGKK